MCRDQIAGCFNGKPRRLPPKRRRAINTVDTPSPECYHPWPI
ncbi:hypothetical protein [Trichloromonas sp.]